MQRMRLTVATLLGVVGTVWVGQGLGMLPGSFMTGDSFWAIVGVVALVVGVYLAWDTLRRR